MMRSADEPVIEPRALYQNIGLVAGPLLALLVWLLLRPDSLTPAGTATASIAVWMAIWWATEAIPVAVTALLPMVLFPLLGVSSFDEAARPYSHWIIWLFFGGFIMALTIERWGLHQRMALAIFGLVGTHARSLIGGFMLAAALISMWISNTSTTMMLLPIAVSVVSVIHETSPELSAAQRRNFAVAMLIGLAFGATIGGMSTLVGTPPNTFLAGFMQEQYDLEIGFAQWMLLGVPISVVLLPICWLLLTRVIFPVDFKSSQATQDHLDNLRESLGPLSQAELRTAIMFCLLVAGWIGRKWIAAIPGLGYLTDAAIAMVVAILLFIIPAGTQKRSLLTWEEGVKLPWGILLLFGGGMSLASAFTTSGLAAWIGGALAAIGTLPIVIFVLIITLLVIFLTELTSNLATATTFLPVMGAIALETGQDPLVVVIPVTLAASCAFMLPIATPPNAIVFGSGYVSIPQMIKAGFVMNLTGVLVLTAVAVLLAPTVFGTG